MRLLSWNVNGIRSVHKKGFCEWFRDETFDILCIQETKAQEEQVPDDLLSPPGYHALFSSAERRGYSGVALYTREKPLSYRRDFDGRFGEEGRIIIAEYPGFVLFDIYFPNGKMSQERLAYKMHFYDAFLESVGACMETGRGVIVCGDVNTAHRAIDLARPAPNRKVSGFLPEECAALDRWIDRGLVDTFRLFESGGGHYTYWDLKSRARDRNVGWRIDYFFVSSDLAGRVKDAFILPEVTGSDHCPIGIEIDL
ncbi:exodeoxyribonuclease III [Methanofollis fontis]|uniref:Exodeoxyribonuclease III n=1 Tax=Methanofollis fontis TaxID=2052832 RepID=A0A483CXK2_9EURY|nr:exodeoxyribonuclease III [Methanofollis fontis]TAJ44033.1 exodeoxyribonuclease III [Methanofollis fontis]